MSLIKFKVSKWCVRPEAIEYSRETAHYYVRPGGGRDAKVTRYHAYFDTEAEALQYIAVRQQAEQDVKRLKQIEAAALDLLAALELARKELHACQAVIHLAGGFDPAYVRDAQAALKVMDEAISRATGGEQ